MSTTLSGDWTKDDPPIKPRELRHRIEPRKRLVDPVVGLTAHDLRKFSILIPSACWRYFEAKLAEAPRRGEGSVTSARQEFPPDIPVSVIGHGARHWLVPQRPDRWTRRGTMLRSIRAPTVFNLVDGSS